MSLGLTLSCSIEDRLLSSSDFPGMPETCSAVLAREYGSFNLLEDIRSPMISTLEAKDTILIRRIHTDELYPYDAGIFITWWNSSGKQDDPVTREDLRYIHRYVELKQEVLKTLPHILLQEITPQFRSFFLDEYLYLVKEKGRHGHAGSEHSLHFRFFVDVVTWKRRGLLFDMTFEESRTYISGKDPGTWLVRKSSQHGGENVMPNSECVTFTIRQKDLIHHLRALHVMGVGWFWGVTKIKELKTFKQFAETRNDYYPKCASFIEIVEYAVSRYNLDWKKLLQIPEK